jgi:putative spermidine/putrescine transport system substrate-binding protein
MQPKTAKLVRHLLQGIALLLLVAQLAACGSGGSSGTNTNGPLQPIDLQVLDAGGYLSTFAQAMIQAFVDSHPSLIKSVQYLPRIQAPDLPGKIQAEQAAHRVTTNLILSGFDGVSSSIKDGLVENLIPTHQDVFPNLNANYQDGAKNFNDLAKGQALVVAYTPSGPLFEYDPAKVPNPPTTIQDLQAWIHANPHKFLYAQPANSGPGRTLLMGLPYLLGDSNPQDPMNGWSKTWAFLKDIKPYMDANPTGTGATMKNLANDTSWIVASTFGWDINPRVLQQVPAGDKTFMLEGTTLVSDAAFMMMPKGLDANTQKVILQLMAWLLTPQAQAMTYDDGYFYPGPAIKNVPLSMAPSKSQQELSQYGRPEYDSIIADTRIVNPLSADNLVAAFSKWNQDIGGS